jgi:hypothetical protein
MKANCLEARILVTAVLGLLAFPVAVAAKKKDPLDYQAVFTVVSASKDIAGNCFATLAWSDGKHYSVSRGRPCTFLGGTVRGKYISGKTNWAQAISGQTEPDAIEIVVGEKKNGDLKTEWLWVTGQYR